MGVMLDKTIESIYEAIRKQKRLLSLFPTKGRDAHTTALLEARRATIRKRIEELEKRLEELRKAANRKQIQQ